MRGAHAGEEQSLSRLRRQLPLHKGAYNPEERKAEGKEKAGAFLLRLKHLRQLDYLPHGRIILGDLWEGNGFI